MAGRGTFAAMSQEACECRRSWTRGALVSPSAGAFNRGKPAQAAEGPRVPAPTLGPLEKEIIGGDAFGAPSELLARVAGDHERPACLLGRGSAEVGRAALVPLPCTLDADSWPHVAAYEVARLERGDLAPTGAGFGKSVGEFAGVLVDQMCGQQCPLVTFEEDHLVFDSVVLAGEPGACARVLRPQGRVALHRCLADAGEETMDIADVLGLSLRRLVPSGSCGTSLPASRSLTHVRMSSEVSSPSSSRSE